MKVFKSTHASQLRQFSHLRKTALSTSKPLPQAPATLQAPVKPTLVAFISGPLEVEPGHFETHYAPRIQKAIKEGHLFILGPSRGTDTLAFEFLRNSGVPPSRIRVYLNTSEDRLMRGNFKQFEQEGGNVVTVKGGHPERRSDDSCKSLRRPAISNKTRVSGVLWCALQHKAHQWYREKRVEEEGRVGFGHATNWRTRRSLRTTWRYLGETNLCA